MTGGNRTHIHTLYKRWAKKTEHITQTCKEKWGKKEKKEEMIKNSRDFLLEYERRWLIIVMVYCLYVNLYIHVF